MKDQPAAWPHPPDRLVQPWDHAQISRPYSQPDVPAAARMMLRTRLWARVKGPSAHLRQEDRMRREDESLQRLCTAEEPSPTGLKSVLKPCLASLFWIRLPRKASVIGGFYSDTEPYLPSDRRFNAAPAHLVRSRPLRLILSSVRSTLIERILK